MLQTQLQQPISSFPGRSLRLKASDISPNAAPARNVKIWWSNAILFVAFHIAGFYAWIFCWPTTWRTWFLCYLNWQLATLGITIGLSGIDKLT